jgi:hypothetical protein
MAGTYSGLQDKIFNCEAAVGQLQESTQDSNMHRSRTNIQCGQIFGDENAKSKGKIMAFSSHGSDPSRTSVLVEAHKAVAHSVEQPPPSQYRNDSEPTHERLFLAHSFAT